MEYPGFFVTFEGPEGSGKSTQINLLNEALLERGYETVQTKEPGKGEVGAKIRRILLEGGDIGVLSEVFLFQADRAEHVSKVVLPALEAGKIVLCDRHADSSVAYQGYGRELGRELIVGLNQISTQGLEPNLTLLLDMSVEAGLQRVERRGEVNRLDREDVAFHRRIREGFLAEAKINAHRFVMVQADAEITDVHQHILDVVLQRLSQRVL